MKSYFADANIFLRFLLQDDKDLYKKALGYIVAAKEDKIHVSLLPEIVFEMEYVLRGVYKLTRRIIGEYISIVVKSDYIKVVDRELLIKSLLVYPQITADLVDIYLFLKARKEGAKVLSFDSDFKKLEKLL